jgi:signal transduction histidine kinase/ActR/RegA family two-component response regulator
LIAKPELDADEQMHPTLPALESVLCTEELNRRPPRPPDYERESRALVSLAQSLADSPHTILQALADTILGVVRADSAGVSLVTEDGKSFYWPAIAGVWKPHIGGGTPRDFGPCGDVLDRNCPLLFSHVERRYTYFLPVTPQVEECLLVPFYIEGNAVGTIWAIAHDDRRKFDNEDLRMLMRLGTFASAAYQSVEQLDALRRQASERQEAAQALREVNEALLVSAIRQHELAEVAESLSTQLQAAVLARDHFIACVSHELRNPLAALSSGLQLLKLAGKEPVAAERSRAMMERQLKQIVRQVDDLLDLSRITTGKLELHKECVDIASVVRDAVEASRPLIDSQGHELTVTLPPGQVLLDADPTRLAQVFLNLLTNAAKYSERGGRIQLSVERDGNEAVVSVRDTGIGIPAANLPHVFAVFVQVDTSSQRSQGGLGIGLSLVKEFVVLHGGRVEARSDGPGKGSEFVVRLPTTTAVAVEPTTAAAEGSRGPRGRVLVVDDNRDAAESLAEILGILGHEVRTAHDGEAGVAVAAEFRPEVVLMDLGMPKVDGYEAARRIRAEPWGSEPVLVALTGWGADDDRWRTHDAGFDRHLVKPVALTAITELFATLRSAPPRLGSEPESRSVAP